MDDGWCQPSGSPSLSQTAGPGSRDQTRHGCRPNEGRGEWFWENNEIVQMSTINKSEIQCVSVIDTSKVRIVVLKSCLHVVVHVLEHLKVKSPLQSTPTPTTTINDMPRKDYTLGPKLNMNTAVAVENHCATLHTTLGL